MLVVLSEHSIWIHASGNDQPVAVFLVYFGVVFWPVYDSERMKNHSEWPLSTHTITNDHFPMQDFILIHQIASARAAS